MKFSLVFILVIIFVFSGFLSGQDTFIDKNSATYISPKIKGEIVRRILIHKFKPAKHRKTIRLAKKDLEYAWLPKIANVEFRLLSDEEIEDSASDLYFFREPETNGKICSIGFAIGNPRCYLTGEIWNFRIVKNRLKLWRSDSGFGSGCAVG